MEAGLGSRERVRHVITLHCVAPAELYVNSGSRLACKVRRRRRRVCPRHAA
jgi:hypothetical protein